MKAVFILLICLPITSLFAQRIFQRNAGEPYKMENLIVDRFVDSTGKEVVVINVPGKPPDNFRMPVAGPTESAYTLPDVPAYDWSFGCSPTSAAMMAGYYDRTGFEDMYTGPTNGGLAPMDNSCWGSVVINGETRKQCPLSATRMGVDDRATRGHVDDYWIQYGNYSPDPFMVNGLTEHTYEDCTGDFMKTSQYNYGFSDGASGFYYYSDGSPHCSLNDKDGLYGFNLFFQSRGYSVESYYTQLVQGYNGNTLGFTFEQYKQEIDAGRPVLIQVTGHTMLGFGYDESGNQIYLHDTWDYSAHTMTWGGYYSTMLHWGVGVLRLSPINVSCPNNGEIWRQGSVQTIIWKDGLLENVKIELYKGGTYYSTITASTPSSGSFSWLIPLNQNTGSDYKVKIISILNDSIYDFSDAPFSVICSDFEAGTIGYSQTIAFHTIPDTLIAAIPSGGSTPYSYQWQSSPDSINFTDISGANSLSFIPSVLMEKTYYRQIQTASNNCGSIPTNTIVISVIPPTPCHGIPTFTYGGKTYHTIQLGSQCWFKENLNIGNRVTVLGTGFQTDNGIIEKFCYQDIESNCDIYGGLYQWNEMMQYDTASGGQGICPHGWHIPDYSEWMMLSSWLGGANVAGGRMKENGTTHWFLPNTGANNVSTFTALPGGCYWFTSTSPVLYKLINHSAMFYTSSVVQPIQDPYILKLAYNSECILQELSAKQNGFSVRCLRESVSMPTLSIITTSISEITNVSSTVGGVVECEGVTPLIACGICWSVNSNPTISDDKTINGMGPGVFLNSLTGLIPGTQYYVRAYATDSSGTYYGNQLSFFTLVNPILPTISTSEIKNIDLNRAESGGNAILDGGAAITAKGVCWSTLQNPTIADYYTFDGTGTGTFTSTITNLMSGTTYYLRAYATNNIGTTYGSERIFNTLPYSACPGTVTVTYGGQIYNTIQIGNQCWLKENLNIGIHINGIQNQTNNSIIEKYCYNNEPENCTIYGGLYKWNEMMQYVTTQGVQGICPSGWHIPTDDEWCTLSQFLDPMVNCNIIGGSGITVGNELQEAGDLHWNPFNYMATNSSGFTALPCGYRGCNSSFLGIFCVSPFWTSTSSSPSEAWKRFLKSDNKIYRFEDSQTSSGQSVRCVKDTCSYYSNVNVTITPSLNPIPIGTSVTLSAIIENGGSAPSFFWKVNGLPVAIDTSSFTYMPNDNDTIVCIVTSSLTCVANFPATSNLVIMDVTWETCPGLPTVTYSDKTYNTVKIGDQCWLKENIDVGGRINGNLNQASNDTLEKYCYSDLDANCTEYGGLYQWGEVVNYVNGASNTASWNPVPTGNVQGICPVGWHIPTDAEFTMLANYLGGATVAGGKMKECGTTHWLSSNTGATNSSGFTSRGSGHRSSSGSSFSGLKSYAYYWIKESGTTGAGYRNLYYYNDYLYQSSSGNKSSGYSVRCIKGNAIPTVVTTAASTVSGTTTIIYEGKVASDGGAPVTARGVCWGVSSYPMISGNHTEDGSGTGIFSGNIIDLQPATTYYIRAYATNSEGTSYGDQKMVTVLPTGPCPDTPSILYDGKTYETVQIGSQCWLNENLNTGITVPGSINQSNNDTLEKYCYSDLDANCSEYGGLYQWGEVVKYVNGASNTTSWNPVPTGNVQGICPVGWHIPTDAEFTTLANYLGGDTVAGGKMKEWGSSHWYSPNTGATNSSGFTARGSAYRNSSGSGFFNLKYYTYYWIKESGTTGAGYRNLYYYNDDLYQSSSGNKSSGYSVRCIKGNAIPTVATTAASTVSGTTTVTSGGDVISDGGAPVTARGVCWSTSANPLVTGSHTVDGSGNGVFISNVTGLGGNTLYYLRAYATNSQGTSYGGQISFTTPPGRPSVNTNYIRDVTASSATCGGTVISDGGAPITSKGFCWGIAPHPDLSGNFITNGSGTGAFTASLTGLQSSTLYYVRSYATNQFGTNYGNEIFFTTCGGIISAPFSEGFENGGQIAPCWTQEQVSNSGINWTFRTGNGSGYPSNAHNGSYNACLADGSSGDNMTRLITPPINLNNLDSPILKFWHTQANWGGDQDQLRVYNKTSATGTWTLLATYLNNITVWTQETIDLPNPGAEYFIAFEGNAKYGRGVCIDDVEISGILVNNVLPGTVVVPGQSLCFDATQIITAGGNGNTLVVNNGASVTLIAGQKILFYPGVNVLNGGYLNGYISPNGPYCNYIPPTLIPNSTISGLNNNSGKGFHDYFDIYPNPFASGFILDLTKSTSVMPVKIAIHNLMGKMILSFDATSGKSYEVSMDQNPPGIYIVRVEMNGYISIKKLIKQ